MECNLVYVSWWETLRKLEYKLYMFLPRWIFTIGRLVEFVVQAMCWLFNRFTNYILRLLTKPKTGFPKNLHFYYQHINISWLTVFSFLKIHVRVSLVMSQNIAIINFRLNSQCDRMNLWKVHRGLINISSRSTRICNWMNVPSSKTRKNTKLTYSENFQNISNITSQLFAVTLCFVCALRFLFHCC